jgi:hypothetical protein
VSIRSWHLSEDAYGRDPTRKIYLEYLTHAGIGRYVHYQLEQNTQMALRSIHDIGFEDLTAEIIGRAQGVYQWVYLVVFLFCLDITYGDDVSLLYQAGYKEWMALTFQLILEVPEPLTSMSFSFLEESDTDFALHEGVSNK